ncbi:hypothetical protein RJ639_025167 [Escallonia herrerae]|uniref:Retrotransposon gag domain-containing protein n=1 Tax=Escallonia herrerae TaxID=1293975 RepID=A0AA89ACG3_9ASTE|nr:hypothetical protein RJ639_026492 [Escallonia herrerae]KAK2998053.1 hypothetical protein RJ639_025167 [Escallonia herrerae]
MLKVLNNVKQPHEMLNTAQVLGETGLPLDKFVKLIKSPFFRNPDLLRAKEWLARAEKMLDTIRILNSQILVYTSFMLKAIAERWWKLLCMKWKREGVPSTWENFKREFTNKYVAVTQEKREVIVDGALAIENDLEEQKNVDTKPFRALSYDGQGNRNSGNVNPGGKGQDNQGKRNLQENVEKPRVQGRAYILESREVQDTSKVIEVVGEHTVYADLIVLRMRGFDILLGMDWLSSN